MAKANSSEKITLDEHRLWATVHQVYSIITQCEEMVANGTGVTAQQLGVLWFMEFINNVSGKPIKITGLAPSLYRSINSVSTIIDRMEKKGLIKKVRDLPDRRAIHLIITRKGERKHIEALKPNRRLIKNLLSVYSEDEMRTLTVLLKKLKKKAQDEHYIEKVPVDPVLIDTKAIANFLNKEP